MSEEELELISKVKDFINECRKEMPEVTDDTLCDNGAIYYMNGNDGTDFDWSVNCRTCEFMLFYKSTEYGFIKSFVDTHGVITAYVYKEDYQIGDDPVTIEKTIMTKHEARELMLLLGHIADDEGLWDKTFEELGF